jgi:hypothetical protein
MQGLEFGIGPEPAAGEVDGSELTSQQVRGDVGRRGLLHDDGGGGADGTERTGGQGRLEHAGGRRHDVAPDVTVGDEELAVGDDDEADEEPVLPVVPVVPESDVAPDEVLPVSAVEDDPSDVEVVLVVVACAALTPGRSCATARPMATVAPVAATMAPRVT